MSESEHWRRIEELCHAAMERHGDDRAAFLAGACGDDGALRREVEALLADEDTARQFLDAPIGRIASDVMPTSGSPSMDRRIVTHYRIIEKLGGGGMGVVYRADDLKLRRSVALKFLHADATRDDEARRRFVIEARAASALDHPNICTIYEVDRAEDGQVFIAMACYDGETLKKKIERGPLQIDEAIDYAIQIVQGLVKAHAAGIIHRDIKPANTVVTDDGLVKILDFGIAKLSALTTVTRPGSTLGTLAYMSPEQLACKPVDARSDLWSVGVVLYEMLSGRPPFGGDHPSAIAVAVERATPQPLTAARSDVPIALVRVVDRSLAKNPDDRYQGAADLLSELRRIKEGSARQPSAVQAGQPPSASRRMRWRRMRWVAAAPLALAVALTMLIISRRGTDDGLPRLTNPVQVAASIGEERLPSWSPNGRFLAYQSDQAGNNDIWISQIGGGSAINRTGDFAGGDEAPRLSPDGRQIAFWSAREDAGVFVMPALGGPPRKIAPGRPDVGAAAAWSPDGDSLVYPIVNPIAAGQPRLEILNLRNGSLRRVPLAATLGGPGRPGAAIDLAWSPNGRFLAVLQANSYNNQTSRIWVLRLSDEHWAAVTDNREINWSPSWSPDNRSLFFTSNRGGTMDLWRQRMTPEGEPVGPPDRVTTGMDVLQATFTADGRRLAYAKGRRVANVWRVPVFSDRLSTWSDAQQVTIDQRYIEAFDLSPDGQRLVVASDRGGHDDIWLVPAGGGEMQQLTDDPTPDWWPAWSPDGREVVFYSNRTGNRQLWIQPVAGGPARRLTEAPATFPRWSRDGKEIFFAAADGQSISAIPVTGGEPRQIMHTGPEGLGTMEFSFAPDGRSFAAAYGRLPDRRLWRFPASGGDGVPLTKGQATAPRWSPDGKWIYFTTFRERGGATFQLERSGLNVWRVAPDGKPEQPVTNLAGRRGYLGLTIATDGRWLYFTWREDIADIWVMDVEGLPNH